MSRRRVLRAVGVCITSAMGLGFASKSAIAGLIEVRGLSSLTVVNVHTTEQLVIPYQVNGKVAATVLPSVRRLLHDHHDGSLHDIDSRLLSVLHAIMERIGSVGPINVVSGYRSPHTNAALRLAYDGVAANSFHMRGQALDFWVPNIPLATLHAAALAVRGGGVGYYPTHKFIHIDVGPIRQWGESFEAKPSKDSEPIVMINGHPTRLTPSQTRTLARHRRALAWEHNRNLRKRLGTP